MGGEEVSFTRFGPKMNLLHYYTYVAKILKNICTYVCM